MKRKPEMDGLELLAAIAGGVLSLVDVFIGLVAMPFAGAGHGISQGALNYIGI